MKWKKYVFKFKQEYVYIITAVLNIEILNTIVDIEYFHVFVSNIFRAQDLFFIDENTGELTSVVNLDRESAGGSRHSFTVRCTDLGVPNLTSYVLVTIYVDDINDWVPRIVERGYIVHVPERSAPHWMLTLQVRPEGYGLK